ncbi:MAG: methyltransferase [Candidatus Rokubacteria bacterium]|nr:methyltransferase [Candidatus Rokubacteria bacterium]MBI2161641.1 methyltransferase [Candidatus Rokubacteria bacterium]
MESSEAGVHLFAWRGCMFRISDRVQPPKAGSLFFCEHLAVRPGERVLEIGSGVGLAAVVLAKAGASVVATDVVPEAVDAIRTNALLNGVSVDARLGDCYAPVAGGRFDLICTNPPQMPTPPNRARRDAGAAADNGGVDGWEILDRVIAGAPGHLVPGGRLAFTIFAFLGKKTAFAKLEAAGLQPSIVASETQPFPRIGYERLEHIRSVDPEGTVPATDTPSTVERFVIQGTLPS